MIDQKNEMIDQKKELIDQFPKKSEKLSNKHYN